MTRRNVLKTILGALAIAGVAPLRAGTAPLPRTPFRYPLPPHCTLTIPELPVVLTTYGPEPTAQPLRRWVGTFWKRVVAGLKVVVDRPDGPRGLREE